MTTASEHLNLFTKLILSRVDGSILHDMVRKNILTHSGRHEALINLAPEKYADVNDLIKAMGEHQEPKEMAHQLKKLAKRMIKYVDKDVKKEYRAEMKVFCSDLLMHLQGYHEACKAHCTDVKPTECTTTSNAENQGTQHDQEDSSSSVSTESTSQNIPENLSEVVMSKSLKRGLHTQEISDGSTSAKKADTGADKSKEPNHRTPGQSQSLPPDYPMALIPRLTLEQLQKIMKCDSCQGYFHPKLPVFPFSQVYRCRELHKICVVCRGNDIHCQPCKTKDKRLLRLIDRYKERQFTAYDYCNNPVNRLITTCDLCQDRFFTFAEKEHWEKYHPGTVRPVVQIKIEESQSDTSEHFTKEEITWSNFSNDREVVDLKGEHAFALEYFNYTPKEATDVNIAKDQEGSLNKCPFIACNSEQTPEHMKETHNYNDEITVQRSEINNKVKFSGCFSLGLKTKSIIIPLNKTGMGDCLLFVRKPRLNVQILSKHSDFKYDVDLTYTDKNRERQIVHFENLKPVLKLLALSDLESMNSNEDFPRVFFVVRRKQVI